MILSSEFCLPFSYIEIPCNPISRHGKAGAFIFVSNTHRAWRDEISENNALNSVSRPPGQKPARTRLNKKFLIQKLRFWIGINP